MAVSTSFEHLHHRDAVVPCSVEERFRMRSILPPAAKSARMAPSSSGVDAVRMARKSSVFTIENLLAPSGNNITKSSQQQQPQHHQHQQQQHQQQHHQHHHHFQHQSIASSGRKSAGSPPMEHQPQQSQQQQQQQQQHHQQQQQQQKFLSVLPNSIPTLSMGDPASTYHASAYNYLGKSTGKTDNIQRLIDD